jgi:hypothetical protein
MRWLIFACVLACDEGPTAEMSSPDLSVPKIIHDLSGSGGTTCEEATTCMQGCSGNFASCSGACASQLTPTAQSKWDSFVACLQLHCGPGDGSVPICDNFGDMSCIACAQTFCDAELADCANH